MDLITPQVLSYLRGRLIGVTKKSPEEHFEYLLSRHILKYFKSEIQEEYLTPGGVVIQSTIYELKTYTDVIMSLVINYAYIGGRYEVFSINTVTPEEFEINDEVFKRYIKLR